MIPAEAARPLPAAVRPRLTAAGSLPTAAVPAAVLLPTVREAVLPAHQKHLAALVCANIKLGTTMYAPKPQQTAISVKSIMIILWMLTIV